MRPLFRLLALLVTLVATIAPAAAANRTIVILDASGSMWAQIDGRARIDIARDTLKQVLAGVPSDLELGFMAYGHRTKGDCNDIEMLVDPAAGTADAISAAADTLSPKGKTPLTAAVKMAADQLKGTEDKATVVLITDGIETCDADPCALAGELGQAGIDLTVNVVGFGLSADEGAQVKCLADDTNGIYLQVDDQQGLEDAINTAVNDAPPPEQPTPAEPEPDYNFAPVAVLTEGDDPLVDGDGTVEWDFYSVGADGQKGDDVRSEYGNAYTGAIDPGTYIVEATLDNVHTSQTVTIEAGKVARPVFDFEAGHLDLRPIHSEGADVDGGAEVYMVYADGTDDTEYGEYQAFVPTGDVQVKVTIGAASADVTVPVAAGERVVRDIVVGAGRATVNAYYVEGMKVEDQSLFIDIVAGKKDIQGNRAEFASNYGPDVNFDLIPGDYTAIAQFDAVTVEQPFSVVAGQLTPVDIILDAGVLAVDAPGAEYVEVFSAKKDIQGNRTSFGGTYDLTASRTLPAGDYHIVASLPDDGGTREADATITAGERTEISIP